MSRRWRYPRPRRGSYYGPAPVQVTAPPPVFVPGATEPAVRGSRLALLRARRGSVFSVPPVGVVTPPAPWPPKGLSRRLASSGLVRRGRYYSLPPAQITTQPPVTVPSWHRTRVQPALCRRGRTWAAPYVPVQAPVAPWVPPYARRHPLSGLTVRRGRYRTPVPVQLRANCPEWRGTQARTLLPLVRRGRRWPVAGQASPPGQTATWPVRWIRRPRASLLPARQGAFLTRVPAPGVAPVVPYTAPQDWTLSRRAGATVAARAARSTAETRSPGSARARSTPYTVTTRES